MSPISLQQVGTGNDFQENKASFVRVEKQKAAMQQQKFLTGLRIWRSQKIIQKQNFGLKIQTHEARKKKGCTSKGHLISVILSK